MRIIRHTRTCPADAQHSVIALGNFDGIHLGHKEVIGTAVTLAKKAGVPSAVMTFRPHPLTVLRPGTPPLRITPFRQKVKLLEALGVDITFAVHFSRTLSMMPAEVFVEQVLVQHLRTHHIVTGQDFVFGHNRGGNTALLEQLSAKYGFGFTCINPISGDGHIFSSTLIRTCLKEGNVEKASNILGHPYEIEGRVRHGKKRGAALGIPTANLALKNYLRPRFGIYIAEVCLEQEQSWRPAICSIGKNPTFEGTEEVLEVHLFDFSGDLYGKRLRVRLLTFLREEETFSSEQALTEKMHQDCLHARHYFTTGEQAHVH